MHSLNTLMLLLNTTKPCVFVINILTQTAPHIYTVHNYIILQTYNYITNREDSNGPKSDL